MALVNVETLIYEPSFNIDTNTYYDVYPFQPNKRNNTKYSCDCKKNAFYSNYSVFNNHMKTKGHMKWLETYKEPEIVKEIKEYKKMIEEKDNIIKRYMY